METKRNHVIQNSDELEFVIFCIENVALHLGIGAEKVYDILTWDGNILSHYIIPEYETLHTQGKDYIVEDILSVMREEGVWK